MRILVKTEESLKADPSIVQSLTGSVYHSELSSSASKDKLIDLCGKVVFCYNIDPNGRLYTFCTYRKQNHINSWVVPDWMIEQILVE